MSEEKQVECSEESRQEPLSGRFDNIRTKKKNRGRVSGNIKVMF